MLLHSTTCSSPLLHSQLKVSPLDFQKRRRPCCSLPFQIITKNYNATPLTSSSTDHRVNTPTSLALQILGREFAIGMLSTSIFDDRSTNLPAAENTAYVNWPLFGLSVAGGAISCLSFAELSHAAEGIKINAIYEVGELFELGIQLSYLLVLLGLLGFASVFVIRQVLLRRELDLSAKELQEQVRSGDASGTELFELGAVMLRRKFYPAAIKYLIQAIDKWDGDDEDLAQVYNALGVSYARDEKLDKAITQFETAVKLQPGYVTAWNNLGDAYEKKKDLKSALKAFEEVLLYDPENKVALPRRDDLKARVKMYKGIPVKSKER